MFCCVSQCGQTRKDLNEKILLMFALVLNFAFTSLIGKMMFLVLERHLEICERIRKYCFSLQKCL